jgi:hypothetical protein
MHPCANSSWPAPSCAPNHCRARNSDIDLTPTQVSSLGT